MIHNEREHAFAIITGVGGGLPLRFPLLTAMTSFPVSSMSHLAGSLTLLRDGCSIEGRPSSSRFKPLVMGGMRS